MQQQSAVASSFVLVALIFGVCLTARADDLCQARDVRRIEQDRCEVRTVPRRLGGEIAPMEVAIVLNDTSDFDEFIRIYKYAVRAAQGKIELLNEFPYLEDHFEAITERLGLEASEVEPGLVYEKVVERVAGRYCATYIAKFPFAGEFTHCGDRESIQSSLGYADGVISAAAAYERVCTLLESEDQDLWSCDRGVKGGVDSKRLLIDEAGDPTYRLIVRIQVRSHPELAEKTAYSTYVPLEFDERVYDVALNGEVRLKERYRTLCIFDCKRIEAGNVP
jgi:hypothetical protein